MKAFAQQHGVARILKAPRTAPSQASRRSLICCAQAVSGPARINIQGKHLELTEPIRDYVNKKLGHAIDPYKVAVNDVDVRLSARGGDSSRGGKQQTIEVTIRTGRHGVVRAEETRDDLYASIDVASDKIHRSLRKLKEKSVKKGQWPGRGYAKGAPGLASAVLPEELGAPVTPDYAPSDDEVEAATAKLDMPASVKRTKVFYLDSMPLTEAIDQLEQVDHDFYIYLDEDSGHVQVVYKRDDGESHGVIVTIPDESEL